MEDAYIGTSIYCVYGDDFIEPITKEHAKIIEKENDYYLAKGDDGITFIVDIDDGFINLAFTADIGTDYRVFTSENDADRYFDYLKTAIRKGNGHG